MRLERKRGSNMFTDGNNQLAEAYDEFDEVYGCIDETTLFVRCCDCIWEGCPMRGGKKEVA